MTAPTRVPENVSFKEALPKEKWPVILEFLRLLRLSCRYGKVDARTVGLIMKEYRYTLNGHHKLTGYRRKLSNMRGVDNLYTAYAAIGEELDA